MRFDAAHQEVVAVVKQVVCGDRSGDVLASSLDELDGIAGGDVFKHDAQSGKLCREGDQCRINEGFFAVKNVAVGSVTSP